MTPSLITFHLTAMKAASIPAARLADDNVLATVSPTTPAAAGRTRLTTIRVIQAMSIPLESMRH